MAARRMLPQDRTEQEHKMGTRVGPVVFFYVTEGGTPMWMKTSLVALGMASALAAATPAPTLGQGVYIVPAAWGSMWAGRVGESAITEAVTTMLMSAGSAAPAAGR